jgi:release factor glutamine methyltransferase
MTIGESLVYIQNALAPSNGNFALPQSEEILCAVTGLNRTQLYISSSTPLPDTIGKQIQSIIERRLKNEPLPYILGSAYFYDREFVVSPSVLIPRPDTEILVEVILKREPVTPQKFIDIGTGSGIIVCTLTEHRAWDGFALDISIDALRIARKNAHSNIKLLCADLFSAIKAAHQFDFIVSNPPYIPDQSIPELDVDVKDFEPLNALRGGKDGLWFYQQFARNAAKYIKKEGYIYCEIGYDQAEACKSIFELHRWREIMITYDLGHNPRVISARVPE